MKRASSMPRVAIPRSKTCVAIFRKGQAQACDIAFAIVALSLVGIASKGIVSLFQTGIIRHLPDPPVKRPHLHSDKVNSSDEAYSYGMPDAPIAITAHGVNTMLAAAGPLDRAQRRPWLR